MTAFEPFDPQRDGPWDRPRAAHLLRRAGFAPTDAEAQQALADGAPATVDRLLGEGDESPRFVELDAAGDTFAAGADIDKLAGWWLSRMVYTRRPLRARLTLFWHNHFATSNVKVKSPALMLSQLRTFEKQALGPFEELALAVSRDPAMIVWLDGESNRKGKPNENYARELFELFTLGPGNYSEVDIREAARAFSGWHQKQGRFQYNERAHDDGDKTVLGRRGALDGADVVRLAVSHSACSRFLAGKLLREFLCDEPAPELIEEFAGVLRDEKLNIAAGVRRLLLSRAMFAPQHYRARIKSPVELCVGLVRSLEMRAPGIAIHHAASQMGQRLFEPPTVKGWEGRRRWINSATMLVRMNTATTAAQGGDGKGLDAAAWVARAKLESAADAVALACRVMLDDAVSDDLRTALREACSGSPEAALRTAVAAIGASPDYQLA